MGPFPIRYDFSDISTLNLSHFSYHSWRKKFNYIYVIIEKGENKKSFFSTLIENSDNVPLESHSANEYAVR